MAFLCVSCGKVVDSEKNASCYRYIYIYIFLYIYIYTYQYTGIEGCSALQDMVVRNTFLEERW